MNRPSPKSFLVPLLVLILLNLLYLDYRFFFQPPAPTIPLPLVSPLPSISPTSTPFTVKTSPTPTTLSPLPTTVPQTRPLSSITQIIYIPLGSGADTTSTFWTAISGSEFTLNLADYPTGAQVHWQANLKSRDPGSRCYSRIYDTTHSRAVDYSEQSTTSTAFDTLTSQPLAIWAGENHYRLEIKSLTSTPCTLSSPKLTIKH